MQLVLADGRVLEGEEALPQLLKLMRGWRGLAWVLRLPVLSWVAPMAYRWVARNRHALSVIVARKGGTAAHEHAQQERE